MHLYLVRHAEALPVGQDGIADDADRPLSAEGREQGRLLAEALRRAGVQFDRVITSPLLRARQTAELLIEHGPQPGPELVQADPLLPGSKRRKLTRYLRDLGGESVAAVGHNPDLSVYSAWLIGNKQANVELAKAGVACLEFEDQVKKAAGSLLWLVSPAWYQAPALASS